MAERMYRYTVPIDGQPHTIPLAPGHTAELRPLHVAATPGAVEFWAVHSDEYPKALLPFTFQVFGTGHDLPPRAWWRGTTPRTPQGLVWHLFEVPALLQEGAGTREHAMAPDERLTTDVEPDLDRLTRSELAELPGPAHPVAQALDEWNHRENGITSSAHGVGLFLDLLAEHGHRVTPIPAPDSMLPPPHRVGA